MSDSWPGFFLKAIAAEHSTLALPFDAEEGDGILLCYSWSGFANAMLLLVQLPLQLWDCFPAELPIAGRNQYHSDLEGSM